MDKARQISGVGVLICALLWTGALRADEIRLSDLEAHALRSRPAIAASDARIAQAKARIALARAAYAPALTLLGDASIAPGGQLVALPIAGSTYLVGGSKPISDAGAWTPRPRYGVSLDMRGTLYDFGRTEAAVDSAMAQRKAAQADARKAADDVVRDVRAAYVRWATAHALWAISSEAASAAQKRIGTTSAAIEEGARPTADRIASQTEAAFAQLELERASAELETARLDLSLVCVTDLAPEAQPQAEVLERGELPRIDKGPDPSLAALEQQRAAAQSSARVHDRAFLPILTAQAQAGIQGQSASAFPVYRLGVGISVPLWDGGGDHALRDQAQGRASELEAQTRDYAQLREHERKRAQLMAEQAERRLQLAGQLVALTRERVAQLEEGYPLGAATLQQVADARGAQQKAATELVLAQAMRAEAQLGVY
jgi:outer membrane protein TolC